MASASSGDNSDKKSSNNNHMFSGLLGKTGTDEAPLDRTYYNTLNVSPTASATEIKRAYYTLSLQYHPDRTQSLDDLTRRDYAERFKLISQAYTILSDPEKRTLYNRYGKDERVTGGDAGGISLDEFDAEEFFRFMFGGEEFIDIIGDFELAKSFTHAISEMFSEADATPEQKAEQQRHRLAYAAERTRAHEQRIEQLAMNLKGKLALFTDASEINNEDSHMAQAFTQFIEIMLSSIPSLLQAPHGEQLLHSIGYIYSSKARFWSSKMDSQEGHLGKRLLGYGKHVQSSWKDRFHVVKETVKTVKCAVQWGQSMSKLAQVAEQEATTNESQMPFQHHSGHLEYSGSPAAPPPSDSDVITGAGAATPPPPPPSPPPTVSSNPTAASPVKQKSSRKSAAQPIVPLTDEEKRQLEADTAAKSMEALWRATKLEIESVERDVCDRVLNDSACSRELRRYRCKALSKLGELWQQASLPATPASAS